MRRDGEKQTEWYSKYEKLGLALRDFCFFSVVFPVMNLKSFFCLR